MPGVVETATRKSLAETILGELRRGLLDRRDGSSPTTSGLPAGWCILSEQRNNEYICYWPGNTCS